MVNISGIPGAFLEDSWKNHGIYDISWYIPRFVGYIYVMWHIVRGCHEEFDQQDCWDHQIMTR